jgi:Chaperone of endosialidase
MSQLQVTGEAKIRAIQGPVVANSGVITALNGAASQYVRGDGTLADFPSSSGGGSSVSYYLNSSVSQGTIGGVAYRELSKDPIIGGGTDIAISSNGYVANYITDANDPDVVLVPGGNFNCEFYFSVNNNTGNPTTYAELYKYDGSTFTLLGSSSGVPESISQGTTIAPYYFAIPVATDTLAVTDRLAIRIYVNVDGRTVTLHTENGHLCQVVTTLSKGMVSLNNLTDQSQYLTVGTAGTDFNIVSSGDTHTFNIPSASASNRGLITTGSQTIAGIKTFGDSIQAGYGISLYDGIGTGALVSANYTGFYAAKSGSYTNITFAHDGDPFFSRLKLLNNATYDYTFPAASGTIALTDDLSAYVTLSTAQTISGNKTFSGTSLFTGTGTFNSSLQAAVGIIFPTSGVVSNGAGIVGLGAYSGGLRTAFNGGYTSDLAFQMGANYVYTFPAASGTIALTSNLSGYLPLTGGTLTGNLAIQKTSGIATINFPVTGSQNEPAFIQHQETTIDSGIMRFSVSDNNLANDYFAFGNTGGGSGAFVESFKITANGLATGSGLSFNANDTFLSTNASIHLNTNNYVYLQGGTGGLWLAGTSSRNNNIALRDASNTITFDTNGSERMRITSVGNVGIGTSSPDSYANRTLQLHNASTGSTYFKISNSTTGSGQGDGLDIGEINNNTYIWNREDGFMSFGTNGVERFQIRNDGLITALGIYSYNYASTANVFVQSDGVLGRNSSSLKYKKNIEDYNKGLDYVMKLRPVLYESRNPKEDSLKFTGFIAEEVSEIGLTELVHYDNNEPDALHYPHFVALLTKAIQELKAEVDILKGK